MINGPLYPESLGGAEIFAHSLATELKQRGHEVIMIGNLKEDTSLNIPYRVISLGPFRRISSRLSNLLWIEDILRRKGLVDERGKVFSVMAHSSILGQRVKSITGSRLHLLMFGGLDLDILANPIISPSYYLYSKIGLLLLNRKSRFVVMSRSMLLKATKSGISKDRCRIIPTFIEQRFFDIDAKDSILNEYNVIFVGRLEKVKGVDLLLDALRLVRKRSPHVKLIVYGRGSLENYVARHGFVDFKGPLPYEKVHEAYRKATIFVLPSRYEGLPNSLLQAMASGLPVVATRVGGVPELIRNYYNGILVHPDPRELSNAILYLLENREKALDMGRKARASVTHLTPERIVSMYEEIMADPA